MNLKNHNKINFNISLFIVLSILISLILKIFLLTALSLLTGILYLALFHSKNKKIYDEREVSLRQKATDFTFSLFIPTLAISAFLFFFPSLSQLSVFSKGEFEYLESLGSIFIYLVLFLIAVYSITYFVLLNQIGKNHEK
ncbi:MAG: DUF2178 domain-containing protein [Candidatus Shapirobacteria bacterium]|nr:DUF2178 domain-containing protein [Candidatus Shapirobacteria bacterium]